MHVCMCTWTPRYAVAVNPAYTCTYTVLFAANSFLPPPMHHTSCSYNYSSKCSTRVHCVLYVYLCIVCVLSVAWFQLMFARGYYMSYQRQDLGAHPVVTPQYERIVEGANPSVTLHDLKPGTTYRIKVWSIFEADVAILRCREQFAWETSICLWSHGWMQHTPPEFGMLRSQIVSQSQSPNHPPRSKQTPLWRLWFRGEILGTYGLEQCSWCLCCWKGSQDLGGAPVCNQTRFHEIRVVSILQAQRHNPFPPGSDVRQLCSCSSIINIPALWDILNTHICILCIICVLVCIVYCMRTCVYCVLYVYSCVLCIVCVLMSIDSGWRQVTSDRGQVTSDRGQVISESRSIEQS